MRKQFKKLSLAFGTVLILAACKNASYDNKPLDFDSLDVNFTGVLAGNSWNPEDLVGIYATCTRNEVTETAMSSKTLASYHPDAQTADGAAFNLLKTSDSDNIIAYATDHNFKFYACAPFDASISDITNIPVDIPSLVPYTPEMKPDAFYVARRTATSIVAPIQLQFKSIVCTISLKIPTDIVDEDGQTVLRSLVIRPLNEEAFSGELAYQASYNLKDDVFTVKETSRSKSITVDFGEEGTVLSSKYTDVSLLLAPFTVPEGGFELVFTDINGFENIIPLLDKESGKEYPAGSAIASTVSSSSDGVIPCSSPAEWPIGYRDDVGVFNITTQPLWRAVYAEDPYSIEPHIWTNPSQTQATITYVMGENHPSQFEFESNNFPQYNYSAPCVKGLWTGDYFDIDIPVKKVAAGTEVTLTIPSYSRGGSLFWDVEYLDGEEWKCNRETFTSPDGQFTKDCTLMIEHGNRDGAFEGITYKVTFTLENAIKSGHIRIHLKVADGQYICRPDSSYSEECRFITAEAYAARSRGLYLFAFVNRSGNTKALSVEW